MLALFFPVSGLMRAVNAIVRFGRWGSSDLEKACRAGALCMVVRANGWLPSDGQTLDVSVVERTWTKPHRTEQDTDDQLDHTVNYGIRADVKVYRPHYATEGSSNWLYSDTSGGRANVDMAATKIHGTFQLPLGYGFAILPRNTRLLEWLNTTDGPSIVRAGSSEIACTYSIAKAMISIIQTLAAFTTLLGHRDDVVHRWGYASFHLTILPYLVMTFFNFASNICTADYDGLYMVETPVMDEARRRGGQFEGTVAATYTATTFGSEKPNELSSSELRSYIGLEQAYFRGLAERLARRHPILASDFLDHLWASLRSGQSTTHTTARVTAVECTENASHTQASVIADCGPNFDPREIDTDHGSCVRQDTAPHAPDLPPPIHCEIGTATAVHLLTDCGLCYVPRVPTVTPSLATAVKKDVFSNSAECIRYLACSLKASMLYLGNLTRALFFKSPSRQGFRSYSMSTSNTRVHMKAMWARFIRSLFRTHLQSPTRERRRPLKMENVTIYIPMCYRFLRNDDVPSEIDEQEILVAPSPGNNQQGHNKSGSLNIDLPVRRWHRITGGALAQLSIGTLVIGVLIVLIGWQSSWFSAGSSSVTQRVVVLLWMCEGMFGVFLTLLTPREIMLIFFVFPLYTILYNEHLLPLILTPAAVVGGGPKPSITGLMFTMTLIPLAIFVAPIWGFVIVGKMLVDWGQCVTLYH